MADSEWSNEKWNNKWTGSWKGDKSAKFAEAKEKKKRQAEKTWKFIRNRAEKRMKKKMRAEGLDPRIENRKRVEQKGHGHVKPRLMLDKARKLAKKDAAAKDGEGGENPYVNDSDADEWDEDGKKKPSKKEGTLHLVESKPERVEKNPNSKHIMRDTVLNSWDDLHIKVTNSKGRVLIKPNVWKTFKEITGLPEKVLKHMTKVGFVHPTPIQAYAWPVVCQGSDLIGIAKTGSGKTLSYLMPAFGPLESAGKEGEKGPFMTVLVPTRELAMQVTKEATLCGDCIGVKAQAVFGGQSRKVQMDKFEKRAPQILVGTPGRMNDFLESEQINLQNSSLLVIDEADRMLDMGFAPQILKIVTKCPIERQTLMFSATWPEEIQLLAADILNNPYHLQIGTDQEFDGNKDITQNFVWYDSKDDGSYDEEVKQLKLRELIGEIGEGRILVFVATKKNCAHVGANLSRFGIKAAIMHGDLRQEERVRALRAFAKKDLPVLVATDIAARGLDVEEIKAVIQYDPPNEVEDYVHRIGRTGRAGKSGLAYLMLNKHDVKAAKDAKAVLVAQQMEVPADIAALAAKTIDNWKNRNRNKYYKKQELKPGAIVGSFVDGASQVAEKNWREELPDGDERKPAKRPREKTAEELVEAEAERILAKKEVKKAKKAKRAKKDEKTE